MVWWMACALVSGITRQWTAGFFVVLFGMLLARPGRARVMALVLGVACVVWGAVSISTRDRDEARLGRALADADTLAGTVAGYPRTSPFGAAFDLDVHSEAGRLRVPVRSKRFDVHTGDRLVLTGRWRRTPGRSLPGYYNARTLERVDTGAFTPGWTAHRHMRENISRRFGQHAPIPLALVLGERGFLGSARRDAYIRLGISHLFALSGMHLGIVAGACLVLMRRLPGPQNLILAAALAAYVGAVGQIDSLDRALVMALSLIVARALRRPARPMGALVFAFVLFLLVRPEALFRPGFQLSFGATWAVLVLVPQLPVPRARGRLAAIRNVGTGLWATILLGTGVNILVAPIQLYHFGETSLVGPLATVLFTPGVALVLVSSMFLALGGNALPFGVVAGDLLGAGVGLLDRSLMWCARVSPDLTVLPMPDLVTFFGGCALMMGRGLPWWARVAGTAVSALSFCIRG